MQDPVVVIQAQQQKAFPLFGPKTRPQETGDAAKIVDPGRFHNLALEVLRDKRPDEAKKGGRFGANPADSRQPLC